MSNTGRFYVTVEDQGRVRTFCVEPIDNSATRRSEWGDINPATKTLNKEEYGSEKNRGSIHEDDSIITKENGFKNIVMLEPGTSPMGYITQLLANQNLKT